MRYIPRSILISDLEFTEKSLMKGEGRLESENFPNQTLNKEISPIRRGIHLLTPHN